MRTLLLLAALTIAAIWTPDSVIAAQKTAAAPIPDAALQQKIQDKFAKSKAGGGKFQVQVKAGVAYLSGRADVAQHKGAATRMAKSAGARRVVNNITVSEAARQKAVRSLRSEKPRQATVKTPS